LEPYALGYRRELDRRGYSPWTAVSYLYSFARVSLWLAEQGLTAADLDAECVGRFLAERPGSRRAKETYAEVVQEFKVPGVS
jgi:integrase/recombinase XerD